MLGKLLGGSYDSVLGPGNFTRLECLPASSLIRKESLGLRGNL